MVSLHSAFASHWGGCWTCSFYVISFLSEKKPLISWVGSGCTLFKMIQYDTYCDTQYRAHADWVSYSLPKTFFIFWNKMHPNCWLFSFWPFCIWYILFRPHKLQNDVITWKQNMDLIEKSIHFWVKIAVCLLISS